MIARILRYFRIRRLNKIRHRLLLAESTLEYYRMIGCCDPVRLDVDRWLAVADTIEKISQLNNARFQLEAKLK